MATLREVLQDAQRRGVAVGHFNFSDLTALRAAVAAAGELNVPVMVGVSEGERALVGVRQAATLVKSLREETGHPIFLNADHTHSLEKAEEAARAGFDEIIFDGSSMALDENVKQTSRAVEAIKSINPAIMVEGEVGYIGTSSEILTKAPEGIGALTTPEEATQFVNATRIDVLAPAVGNMHGLLQSMVRGEAQKHLDIERIGAVHAACGIFMTLHGGSGTNDQDFQRAIKAGMTIVHVNTELRLAWRRGLEAELKAHPEEVAPYKILPGAYNAIKDVVTARLRLFNFLG
ncbi:MAG TPA: class II fructose-bisphosphate aldolase [Candidatus Binataceae bacterium]|jgi:fructose-bisphosphate aldolase class II|nr:class II fructose-bisphosphate aldolase [Candidatus Binataceae bacterium]